MKTMYGLMKAVAVMFLVLGLGSIGAWAEECHDARFSIVNGNEVFVDPAEVMDLLVSCYDPTWVQESFQWCLTNALVVPDDDDHPGKAKGKGHDDPGDDDGVAVLLGTWVLCGHENWFLADPFFPVEFDGLMWMNPGLLDTPEGILCMIEHSVVSGDAFVDGQFIFTALEDIGGGTGIYEGANGWFGLPPTRETSTGGTLEGWICTP